MEPNLYSKLDALTDVIHDNHTEVVQRLTALETQLNGLPERVSALENDKATKAGAASVWSMVLSSVVSFVVSLFFRLKHS